MNLYIDFDGVIVDTMTPTYKMLEELGIDTSFDNPKAKEFYSNLDWVKLLRTTPQINDPFKSIKQIRKQGLYTPIFLPKVNSMQEMDAKVDYIRKYDPDTPIIFVPKNSNKSTMVNPHNAILADDSNWNLYSWREDGGIPVKFSKQEDPNFITIQSLEELSKPKFMRKLIKKL